MIKIHRTIGTMVVALLLPILTYAQGIGYPFYPIGDGSIIAGEENTIAYNSNMTMLKDASTIEGVIYFWKDYQWTAEDFEMVKTDTVWTSKLFIPDSTALIACKFYSGDRIDTTGVYGYFTKEKNTGKSFPSSYTGWGLLRGANSQQYSIPGLIKDTSLFIDDDVLVFWFNQELRYFPSQRSRIFKYALEAQRRRDPEKWRLQTMREVEFILSGADGMYIDEQTYINCINALKAIGNDSLSQKVTENTRDQYPNGILARDNMIWHLFRETDPQAKKEGLANLLERFPTERFADINTQTADLYLGKIFQSVIYKEAIPGNDFTLLYKYIKDIPYNYLSTFFWHMIQLPYRDGHRTASELLPIAKAIMNEILHRPQTGAQKVYSPKEWNKIVFEKNKDALMAYAGIINDTGNPAESVALLDLLKPYYNNKSADFNNLYVQLLQKTGRDKETTTIIADGIKENAATPAMLELLKAEYIKEKGTEEGFDSYLNSLKSAEKVLLQQKRIRESMVNLPIKLFEVERLSGEKVDMAQMKGKIIVIDFWATWCAPCIAAMPGMQMAVNKYKDDPNVAFFFLATQETAPNYKDRIKSLMKSKNYSFDVVLDIPNPDSKMQDLVYSTYARAFKFSGIPQKMIIDGNGKLRWRSTGYQGSPSELADEISYIIELLKAEEASR